MEDLFDPGARRARQRDLEGQERRLADRRRRVLRHRRLRSRHQPDLLGLRQSGSGLRCHLSARATISTPTARIAFDAATGKITWYHQYTPNDNRDYDETGSHILIDTKVNGEDRKMLSHPGRNGFAYTFDRINGQFLKAAQTVKEVNWTKGIDPKTGKPLDYDPAKDIQLYAEAANVGRGQGGAPGLPRHRRAAPISGRRPTAARPGSSTFRLQEGCSRITTDTSAHVIGQFTGGDRRRRPARSPAASSPSIRARRGQRSASTCRIRIRPACCRPRAASWSPR